MAEHERAIKGNRGDLGQKRRTQQPESRPSEGKSGVWDEEKLSLTETPFVLRMNAHAAILSGIPLAAQRQELLMRLHQTYGNNYVQRMVESVKVQPKLSVSDPHDIYEQEADQVAKRVMNLPATNADPPVYIHLSGPRREAWPVDEEIQTDLEEEEESIQASARPDKTPDLTGSFEVESGIENQLQAQKGSGLPLPGEVREYMEPRFRTDFSDVKVHTDAGADRLNQQLGARAFTIGRDVFFRQGEYNPGSINGKELMAHELTHVVQQTGGETVGRAADGHLERALFWKTRPKDEKLMDTINAADQRSLAQMSKDPKFLKEMEKELSQTQQFKAKVLISLGTHAWIQEMQQKLQEGPIPPLKDWVLLKKAAASFEYKAAIQAFDSFKGDAAEKEKFLKKVPKSKLYLFTDLVAKPEREPTDQPLKEQIKTSANPKRAEIALATLTTLQAKSATARSRLTDAIVELLVWGVAKPRAKGDLGSEGLIGIEQADFAAQALTAMPLPSYLNLITKLDLAGGDKNTWDQRQVESVLILKAVAARKSMYKKDEKKAQKEIGEFSDKIREQDLAELIKNTTTRDSGGSGGLQQKFTMTCGPTSIQILHGEADPVFALDVSSHGKHNLDYKTTIAGQQKQYLGKGETRTIPRLVFKSWETFKQKINGTTIPGPDVPKWAALFKEISGQAFNAALAKQGKTLAAGAGFSEGRIAEFKKYYPFDQPGLSFKDIEDIGKNLADIPGLTNRTFEQRQINHFSQADLDVLWPALFKGRDIAMVVLWNNGGGHAMVFTDCKGDPPKGGNAAKYMLSDPWEGESIWLTGQQLLSGDLGKFGAGRIVRFYM